MSRNASESADVVVVGSGPAGSSAARSLAQAGVRVVLLEKERLPRYKTCGGGVVLRAARLAELGSHPCIERTVHSAELHLHDADLHYVVRRSDPLLVTTMRSHLDAWFSAQAARAGAEIRDRCALVGLTPVEGGVEAHTTRGTIRASFLIAADGVASRAARWAGWPANPATVPALEWEMPVAQALLDRHAGIARFDLGAARRGYAWVFPKRDHLSVGILETRRGVRDLRVHLERYLQHVGVGPLSGVERHGALLPLAPRPGGAAQGRVLLAGDAAGFVDPVTCEGITYAIRSGQLAAAALIGAGDAAAARAAYVAAIEREIVPELQMARRLSRVVFGPPRLRGWLFRRVGQSFGELMADVITGRRTYRELMESPTSYAKLALRLLRPSRARTVTEA